MDPVSSYHVVLSIDSVLAVGRVENPQFFLKKNLVMTAVKTHYLLPGALEFIELLFSSENIKTTFFSAGERERNEIFVAKILQRALGKERYGEIKESVSVFSSEHTRLSRKGEGQETMAYGIYNGNKKKDLTLIFDKSVSLENTAFIYEEPTFCAAGQEKNIFKVPYISNYGEHIGQPEKIRRYGGSVSKNLRCYIKHSPKKELKELTIRSVLKGKEINVFKHKGNTYSVGFLDRGTYEYTEVKIPKEQKDLLKHLKSAEKLHKKKMEEIHWGAEYTKAKGLVCLYRFVCEKGGKTQKICKKANRVFFIAGFLFSAIDEAQRSERPLTEVLFQRQYRLTGEDPVTYEPLFGETRLQEHYYHIGLQKLREVNGSLNFITAKEYRDAVNQEPTKEEQEALAELKENEDKGCCLM